jgi:hypothetical protein
MRVNALQIAKNVQMQRSGFERFWTALSKAFEMTFRSCEFRTAQLGLFRDRLSSPAYVA